MYTANSMNCLCEAIGIALPGNGTIPAVYSKRLQLAKHAGDVYKRQVINSPSRLRRQPPQRESLLSDRSVKPPSVREVASRKR